MYVYFAFLSNLVFSDYVQICEAFMQKSGYIISFLQYLAIYVVIYELQ